jgi:haloacetate dehalogenase
MTTHLQSERIEARSEPRLSRRGLVQVLAAGAAAGAATPASADQSAVVAEATSADYARDPTRWGSPEVAALFPGFKHLDMRTKGAIIRVRHGGSGPPLLLLHGYPNNHVLWYAVAARLAERYHVVLADLRGYGDSSLPDPGPNLINYSFRVMAEDMLEVMDNLGYQRFFLVGHDRGARLSHRMCLDHPDRVMKLCLLDMLPNYYTWTTVNKNRAIGAWHWMFMAQPEPFPETMMSAVPAEWFLKGRGNARNPPKIVFDEYIRCWTNKTITGSCRDYRAFATIDFEMDTANKDRQRGAASDLVGNAGSAADAGISNRVAQVREQPRRRAAAPDRPLSARGSAGSGRRSLHQILHDVNGEARVFTLRRQTLRGQAQARSSDYGRR